MGKLKKALYIVLIALGATVLLYLLASTLYTGVKYRDFRKQSEKVSTIPGRLEGFVPQGVSRAGKSTIVCGYMGKGASRIYVIPDKGKRAMLEIRNTDGSVYTGHAGGITVIGEYAYISNASKLLMIPLQSILAAKDGDTVSITGTVKVPCRASFAASSSSHIYVGEFHDSGYTTDESHRVESADGSYQALVFAYPVDGNGKITGEAEICYAVPDRVQGFTVEDGKAYLSISRGFNPSYLKVYDLSGNDSTFNLDGRDIPMVILDSRRLISSLSMPHMSEDIEIREGKLYIAFEGGAAKYGAGLLPSSLFSVKKLGI